jgi:hypothetical protein
LEAAPKALLNVRRPTGKQGIRMFKLLGMVSVGGDDGFKITTIVRIE